MINDVILERGEKKGSEFAFRAVGLLVNPVMQKMGEKPLHQILRIGRGMAAPPNETVKRRPVVAAELGDGVLSFSALRSALTLAGRHDTPASRRERRSAAL